MVKPRMFAMPANIKNDSAVLIAKRGGVPVGAVVSSPAGVQALSLAGGPCPFRKAALAADLYVTQADVPVGLGDVEVLIPDEDTMELAGVLDWFKTIGGKAVSTAKSAAGKVFGGSKVTASAGPITVDLTDPGSRAAALAALKKAAGSVEFSVIRPPDQPSPAAGPIAWFQSLPGYAKTGLLIGAAMLAVDVLNRRR